MAIPSSATRTVTNWPGASFAGCGRVAAVRVTLRQLQLYSSCRSPLPAIGGRERAEVAESTSRPFGRLSGPLKIDLPRSKKLCWKILGITERVTRVPARFESLASSGRCGSTRRPEATDIDPTVEREPTFLRVVPHLLSSPTSTTCAHAVCHSEHDILTVVVAGWQLDDHA